MRALPYFKGKARLGALLGDLTSRGLDEAGFRVRFPLRDGNTVSVDLRDEPHAFWTGEYDTGVVERLTAGLPQGAVILDVGANLGLMTVQFARRLRALRGAVYAFEPVQANYAALVEVIEANGLGDVAVAERLALGDAEGHVRLSMATPRSTGNAVITSESEEIPRAEPLGCRVTRLDTYAQERGLQRCDVIKADIEGFELKLLQGGEEFIRRHQPVIYGEFNSEHLQRLGGSFGQVAELVGAWGYSAYAQAGRSRFRLAPNPGAGLQHVLLVPTAAGPERLRDLGAYR
jgi:FkbM family methyltransferase